MSGRRDPGISRVPSTSRQPDLHAIFPRDASHSPGTPGGQRATSRSLRRSPAGALIFSTVRLRPEPGNVAQAHLLDSNALRTDQIHRGDVVGPEVAVCRRETPHPGIHRPRAARQSAAAPPPRSGEHPFSCCPHPGHHRHTRCARRRAERENSGIGDAPLRPAPKDPSPCVSRWLSRDWWETAEALAGLESKRDRGWYFLRRKLAPH